MESLSKDNTSEHTLEHITTIPSKNDQSADSENPKVPDNDSLDAKLLDNQILVQKLTKQNKELSLQIKEYKDRLKQYSVPQPKTTADIMSRIWDNKEDEYWDII